jgi:hypothetical protein
MVSTNDWTRRYSHLPPYCRVPAWCTFDDIFDWNPAMVSRGGAMHCLQLSSGCHGLHRYDMLAQRRFPYGPD